MIYCLLRKWAIWFLWDGRPCFYSQAFCKLGKSIILLLPIFSWRDKVSARHEFCLKWIIVYSERTSFRLLQYYDIPEHLFRNRVYWTWNIMDMSFKGDYSDLELFWPLFSYLSTLEVKGNIFRECNFFNFQFWLPLHWGSTLKGKKKKKKEFALLPFESWPPFGMALFFRSANRKSKKVVSVCKNHGKKIIEFDLYPLMSLEQILSFESRPLWEGLFFQESKQEVKKVFPFIKIMGKKHGGYMYTLISFEQVLSYTDRVWEIMFFSSGYHGDASIHLKQK